MSAIPTSTNCPNENWIAILSNNRHNRRGNSSRLLPGSRNQEVAANLPGFVQVAELVARVLPATRFAVASFNAKQALQARELLSDCQLQAEVHVGKTGELIEAADVCLACSGSVSLELLYHAKPSVIQYRVTRFAYWLQDRFRIARYITLVNLLATDRLERNPGEVNDPDVHPQLDDVPMPEYLSHRDCSPAIARRILQWLTNPKSRKETSQRLIELRDAFGQPGASRRAADFIWLFLNSEDADSAPPTATRPHFLDKPVPSQTQRSSRP